MYRAGGCVGLLWLCVVWAAWWVCLAVVAGGGCCVLGGFGDGCGDALLYGAVVCGDEEFVVK